MLGENLNRQHIKAPQTLMSALKTSRKNSGVDSATTSHSNSGKISDSSFMAALNVLKPEEDAKTQDEPA